MTEQKHMNSYLEGENIKPRTTKDAKALIGRRVTVLLSRDIDRSGRGYFFPHTHTIAGVSGRNVAVDNPGNYEFTIGDIREMQDLGEDTNFVVDDALIGKKTGSGKSPSNG